LQAKATKFPAIAIKDAISGTGQRGKMLIAIFDDYNKRVHKLIGIDYAQSTWVKYKRTQRIVESFIQYSYGSKDISIQSLDMQFVLELEVLITQIQLIKSIFSPNNNINAYLSTQQYSARRPGHQTLLKFSGKPADMFHCYASSTYEGADKTKLITLINR
jgi:hypothetical protein